MAIDLQKLIDPTFYAVGDAHGLWRQLRAENPVIWTPERAGPGFWSITRHGHGTAVLGDWQTFSSSRGTLLMGNRWEDDPAAGRILALTDPPRQTQMRRILGRAFRPKALAALEPGIAAIVDSLVARASELERFDFVSEVADRLPISVVFSAFGVPEALWEPLSRFILQTTRGSLDEQRAANGELLLHLYELSEERRRRPGDDLISLLITMELDGQLIDAEDALLNLTHVLTASLDTTRLAVATGLFAFMQYPAQWDRLRESEECATPAVEEIVRWASPSLVLCRTATRDVELGGQHIGQGQQLAVWMPSINRDEAVFEAPDDFTVDRRPNPHVGFGVGTHICLGATLARIQLRGLFREMARRWKRVEQTGDHRMIDSLAVYGVDYLPVEVTPA